MSQNPETPNDVWITTMREDIDEIKKNQTTKSKELKDQITAQGTQITNAITALGSQLETHVENDRQDFQLVNTSLTKVNEKVNDCDKRLANLNGKLVGFGAAMSAIWGFIQWWFSSK